MMNNFNIFGILLSILWFTVKGDSNYKKMYKYPPLLNVLGRNSRMYNSLNVSKNVKGNTKDCHKVSNRTFYIVQEIQTTFHNAAKLCQSIGMQLVKIRNLSELKTTEKILKENAYKNGCYRLGYVSSNVCKEIFCHYISNKGLEITPELDSDTALLCMTPSGFVFKTARGGHSFKFICDSVKEIEKCPLAVDGNWGDWTDWSSCERTCGLSKQKRKRLCNNPSKENLGKDCKGSSTEIQVCTVKECPVDGNWGSWTEWSSCAKTCGLSIEKRERFCNNPPRSGNGKDCVGSSNESKQCFLHICEDCFQLGNRYVYIFRHRKEKAINAEKVCTNIGMQLAEINNDKELSRIAKLLKSDQTNCMLIGYVYDQKAKTYIHYRSQTAIYTPMGEGFQFKHLCLSVKSGSNKAELGTIHDDMASNFICDSYSKSAQCYFYEDTDVECYNGRRYYAVHDNKMFNSAQKACKLVHVINQGHNEWLQNKFGNGSMWIGLRNTYNGDRIYKWNDKEPLNYTNWAKDESRHFFESFLPSIVTMNSINGQWSLSFYDFESYFICESNSSNCNKKIRTCAIYDDRAHYFISLNKSLDQAKSYCSNKVNGNLVWIRNERHNNWLYHEVRKIFGMKIVIIGLVDSKYREYKWADGENITFSMLDKNPDSYNKHCVYMTHGKWFLDWCYSEKAFICESNSASCKKSVDAKWNQWEPWSDCTKTCDSGYQKRNRTCNSTIMKYGGKYCEGNTTESELCNTGPCPNFDFIFPEEHIIKVDGPSQIEFVCKIFVYKDINWKLSSIKWKFRPHKDAPLTELLPEGAVVAHNLQMKASTLKFKTFSREHFGHYHCIYDNRTFHPVGVIKGITASLEPKSIHLSHDRKNNEYIKCQFHFYNVSFDSNNITWKFQDKILTGLKIEFDSTTNSSIVHLPVGLNESFSGLYQCLYDGNVAATTTVEISAGGQSCLENNVQCGFEDDNVISLGVCCEGLVCQLVGESIKYCVNTDDDFQDDM